MVSTKKWLDILPEAGTVGILGRHQYGKSALGYHIAEERHRAMGKEAVVLGPPLSLRDRFPEWVHIVTDLEDLRLYPDHTAILDESSWPLHARQTMARDHVGFDKAMSVSVQLGQLFIFCTHHSRKLDPNVVTEYEVLAWKMPKRMHTVMERREIRAWAAEARAVLLRFPPEERRAYTYVLYDDLEETAVLQNPLPSFWCEEIRTAASRALLEEMNPVPTEQGLPKDMILELDNIRRALYGASLVVWDSNPELRDKIVHCAATLKPVLSHETEWSLAIGQEALNKLEECFVYKDVPRELAGLKRRLMSCLTTH